MYCSINGGAYFQEKSTLATISFKKGGGRIFEGGLIFGRLWYMSYTRIPINQHPG